MFDFITKSEKKYILYSGLFAVIYFIFLLPIIIPRIDGNSPFLQFLVFNLGTFIFLFMFLKSKTTNVSLNIRKSAGLSVLILSLSAWTPPLHVTVGGELIKGGLLGVAATDYIFGLLATNLGLGGFLVYLFTYIVAPILLLFLSGLILKNFVSEI